MNAEVLQRERATSSGKLPHMQRRLIAGCLLFLCTASGAHAQARAATRQTSVHVTVDVRRLTDAPIPNLRSSDLTVTVSRVPLHATFSRYTVSQPTFVLLIVAPLAGYTSLTAIRTLLASSLPSADRPAYLFATLGPKGKRVIFPSGVIVLGCPTMM